MDNNSTNINKANDHLSPKTIKYKEKNTKLWKSRSWLVISAQHRLMRLCIIVVHKNKLYHHYNLAVLSICG